MRQFIESLKRLLKCGKIGKDKIEALYNDRKINMNEKDYILSSD